MKLEDLGYSSFLEDFRNKENLDSFDVGRIISEHKDRYLVRNETSEFDAEVIGNLRYTAKTRRDLPAVGDWVALSEYDENKALIHAVFPRKSIIERTAVGQVGRTQVIATNIDFGLIVQSVNRDFSINRLERYMTICNDSNVEPIIVLSKVDLIEKQKLDQLLDQIRQRVKKTPLFPMSNLTQFGLDALRSKLIRGKTYCLLGSSGVGKSTLINTLIGEELMETREISQSIDRGKHVTSHRELIVMENGILIDNPGMREVGIADGSEGIEITFDEISQLALDCKFNDCTHTNETGCAVLDALENGALDSEHYANFVKMRKERLHFESDAMERRKKEKEFGKMVKRVKKRSKET